MIQKIKVLVKSHWDVFSYLFFGVLTTAVSFLVFLPLYNLLGLSATVSNIFSWIAAVTFAYLTNKPFVFQSHDWSAKTVIPELTKFVSCRVASGAMETVIMLAAVDIMHWDGNLWKLITQILVVVSNYVASKLLVFRNK